MNLSMMAEKLHTTHINRYQFIFESLKTNNPRIDMQSLSVSM